MNFLTEGAGDAEEPQWCRWTPGVPAAVHTKARRVEGAIPAAAGWSDSKAPAAAGLSFLLLNGQT